MIGGERSAPLEAAQSCFANGVGSTAELLSRSEKRRYIAFPQVGRVFSLPAPCGSGPRFNKKALASLQPCIPGSAACISNHHMSRIKAIRRSNGHET
jgi:hypothetical protein